MREGWRRVALGEIFELTNKKVGDYAEEPEVFSVTKHDGFVPALEYFGKRVASEALHKYKTVGPGDWAYSTIHIDEGSIARNTLGRAGVVSPMYTTMRIASPDVEPFYLELLLRSPQMLAVYGDTQQGSIDRRRSLSWKAFVELEVDVPPLVEQRRAIDLVAAVDIDLHEAAKARGASESVDGALREQVLQGGELMTVGQILTETKSPVQVEPEKAYEEIGVRSHGRGYFDKDPVTGADLGNKKIFWMQPGALCFNIVFAWEGAVVELDEGVAGKVASHRFPNYVSPIEGGVGLMARYFQTERGRALLVDCSPGGAGRNKTLNRGRLLESVIRVPPPAQWPELVDLMRTAELRSERARAYEDALRNLRSNLLAALLSGVHEIPETYDELLEEAVT